jgi:hypothetical protein
MESIDEEEQEQLVALVHGLCTVGFVFYGFDFSLLV